MNLSINLFISSIDEKQSLKGVIQNVECEIGVQTFLRHNCSAPLLENPRKNTFDRVYCFVKLHPL